MIAEGLRAGYPTLAEYEVKCAAPDLRLPLHILDAGKRNAVGTFAGIAQIKFILGEKYRIAVDIVGDTGAVGGDKCIELLAVVGRNPARQLKLAHFEFHRQR